MYIQNQKFKDEETLLEQLFDFGLGNATTEVVAIISTINNEVLNDKSFQEYRATLTDEEEIMELDDDERRLRLAEQLMKEYDSFLVEKNQLFGVKNDTNILLYTVDLF
jgi:hypothetical protein